MALEGRVEEENGERRAAGWVEGDPWSLEEEAQAWLMEREEVPPLLARALDDIPDGWTLLFVQMVMNRFGFNPVNRYADQLVRHWEQEIRVPEDEPWAHPMIRAHGFDAERGLVQVPSGGGRPRSLLSELIDRLAKKLERRIPDLGRGEGVEHLRRILQPFFPARVTSVEAIRWRYYAARSRSR